MHFNFAAIFQRGRIMNRALQLSIQQPTPAVEKIMRTEVPNQIDHTYNHSMHHIGAITQTWMQTHQAMEVHPTEAQHT